MIESKTLARLKSRVPSVGIPKTPRKPTRPTRPIRPIRKAVKGMKRANRAVGRPTRFF